VAIPRGTRAKLIGSLHGGGNLLMVLLFIVSWLLRRANPTDPGAAEMAWSWIGFALSMVTGWLGGELVERLGVGVDQGANLDSPSSLSGRPAAEHRPPRSRLASLLSGSGNGRRPIPR